MMQAVPTSGTGAATSTTATAGQSDAQKAKLKSAAQAFEAVFLRQMIGSMRSASLGDGMFDNQATSTFQDMADSKTADAMAKRGVLHIADLLVKQLGPIAEKGVAGKIDAAAGAPSAPSLESPLP
ncbi:rod-binding protein [uncultured Sphingomonas sp.]|uniref:rod-binding protein n=1 Tax=uncultured Sphingomonas sp. TaxID=158754 RepID=UPI0026068D6C|nr:rod-binding protein [uncultured Sphingomonas sp.]